VLGQVPRGTEQRSLDEIAQMARQDV
jgi:hypothetical protein